MGNGVCEWRMWWSVCAANEIEERQTETAHIHFSSSIIGRVSASVESNFDFFCAERNEYGNLLGKM